MVRNSRGYRFGLGAALAALIVVCVGLGLYIGALSSLQSDDGANRRSQTEQRVEAPAPKAALPQMPGGADYNPSCKEGQDDRASDLCAQWKAADAANQSAIWTRTAAIVAIAATVVAGLTLIAASFAAWFARQAAIHTQTGAKAAQDAVDETRRIGEAQVRCYLSLTKVQIALHMERVPVAILSIKNLGQSPASDFQAEIVLRWIDFELGGLTEPLVGKHRGRTHTIPPGTKSYRIYYDVDGPFDEKDVKDLSDEGILRLTATVSMKWSDVFGNSFSAEYRFFGCGRDAQGQPGFTETYTLLRVEDAAAVIRAEVTRRDKGVGNHPPAPDEGEVMD